MKKLFALWMLLLPMLLPAAQPNVPLYVRWDGTIAAPTQFLAAVFAAGGGITITDNRTNMTISAAGGGMSTTNFVLTMGQDLTNLIYSIGTYSTNFTISTGTALTNLIYQVGQSSTNFSLYLSNYTAAVSNYTYSVWQSNSNYTFSVWQSNSNYTDSIFTSLSNLISGVSGASITNIGAGTNISIRVSGGTNFIDTIGQLNNWALYPTNIVQVQTNVTVSYITNLTVVNLDVINNIYTSNHYSYNSFITNLVVISNATIKGNTYISQTNFVNYLVSTNLANFGSNIYVAGTAFVNWLLITNESYHYGPALSFSASASNAPAENEFPTAKWVRSLFNNGLVLYVSTNIYTEATNEDSPQLVYQFTNQIPPTSSRTYVEVDAGDYVGNVATTNRFTFLQGPIYVHQYIERINGLGGPTVSLHPEFYYSYDGTNWYGDFAAANQFITTGTNTYEWVISFPAVTSTNATGFLIERRFKVGTATGATHPDVVMHMGTNYLSGSNDASHISIQGVNSTVVASSVNMSRTNRTITIPTNATSLTVDLLASIPPLGRDWYDCPTLMETNLVLSPTNLMVGTEIWVFFTAANGNYDVTVTNTAANDIRWNLNGPTNGSTSFTVTNGQRAELCITCRTNNILHAVYGHYR